MRNVTDEDAQFFAHLQHIIPYHLTLLRDEARNKLFCRALEEVVTGDTRVLDIGSGSGVWAIMAAKLGAKSVTAIEGDSALIPVIRSHARENGVADKIEIIHGNSLEVKPRHKFDVVISETIGNQAFEEGIIATMLDARKRFLARGGIIIPETVSLMSAPAHLADEETTPLGVPIVADYIRNLALNVHFKTSDKSKLRLLAEPVALLDADLRKISSEPAYNGLTGKWQLEDISRVNAVVLWARSRLIDAIDLDTWDTTNWSPVVCKVEPFPAGRSELEFELNLNSKQYHWTVRVTSSTNGATRSYTPMFAYAKLKFDAAREPVKQATSKS
jgi:2-polyprenyl-3-methyl-5-hydroxy-6-metoxy-1,4-benzoquinol methylase